MQTAQGPVDSKDMSRNIQASQKTSEKCQSSDKCGRVQERALCELSNPCGFGKSGIVVSHCVVEARDDTTRLPDRLGRDTPEWSRLYGVGHVPPVLDNFGQGTAR